jgi:hypothetical protein
MCPLKRLKHFGMAAALVLAAAVTVVFAIESNRAEQVFLVNDGLQPLRVNGCDIDGFTIPPGRDKTPIDVTNRLICPVYRNADLTYLGCLVIKREELADRQIPILQSINPSTPVAECDPG